MELDKIISFIKEADKLKTVHRKTLNYNEDRYENSGEHSWHLALATLAFASQSNEHVDVLKCVKMALIHDLVEIDAGDQIIYAEDPDKFDRESKAADRIFGLLPEATRDEFKEIWVEFEKKETAEAKYVGALDRFLPLYSNVLNDGHSWRKHNITYDMILKVNQSAISQGCEGLWEKADSLLKENIELGLLK